MTLAHAALIGVGIGFLGGLLGKGGSAIATPLLHAIGIPAIVAYRAEPRAHTAGTGIGLTIARAVAHAHHGDLTAFSPGVGRCATFILSLPPRRGPTPAAAADQQ